MILDVPNAQHVELLVDQGNKVWLNVDGVCVARVGRADQVHLEWVGSKKTLENGRVRKAAKVG